jgi:hypothetical protein
MRNYRLNGGSQIMAFKHACFMSYRHGKGELMNEMIDQLYKALSDELEPYVGRDAVYIDKSLEPGDFFNERIISALYVNATTPVGRYPEGATPHGLMDMAGNLGEWMENLYSVHETWRSIRGSSWYDSGSSLRCSSRSFINPDYWYVNTGFRVLRSLY